MLRRSLSASPSQRASSSVVCGGSIFLAQQQRAIGYPNWKHGTSTRAGRDRESRDHDRKQRLIEKMPRPKAMHDFPYPTEKIVLSDQQLQTPVYENELDTPKLFNPYPSNEFFVYWNASDFGRSLYPPVPARDHRRASPAVDKEEWSAHSQIAAKYLRKHEIVPTLMHHNRQEVNLSAVFEQAPPRRFEDEEEPAADEGGPAPFELNRKNFWLTAHCGNYIELCHMQKAPRLCLLDDAPFSDAPGHEKVYYTVVIASPDYPYRVHKRPRFMLHSVIANVQATKPGPKGSNDNSGSPLAECTGDVMVPYVPPLPTEGAGSARLMFLAFRQEKHQENVAVADLPFSVRADYTLHQTAQSHDLPSLESLEMKLPSQPAGITFCHTDWDIQVQEFYEKIGQPEPAYFPEDVEDILTYNNKPYDWTSIKSIRNHDGSLCVGENIFTNGSKHHEGRTEQKVPTVPASNIPFLKKSTLRSRDGKWIPRMFQSN